MIDEREVQERELSRVSDRIAAHVLAFCRSRETFHMQELVAYVAARVPEIAPDSPSRILRDLKRNGLVNYRVVSRSQSLYQVTIPMAQLKLAVGL